MDKTEVKKNNNIWKTISFILIGLIIGYIIGRFELTTIRFINDDNLKDVKTDTMEAEEEVKKEDENVTVNPLEVSTDDDPFLGSENAPIVLIDFSDYQCPFCKKFYTDIFPYLKEDFIDTGKLKYVYRDFPLNIHPKAFNAAYAAECADDQGKYWEMHDYLFDNQSDWGKSENVNETLISYAKDLGLNSTTFSECLNKENYKNEVENDINDARSYGVKGTPTLFINGKIIKGLPRSYSLLEQYLENELM